MRRSVFTRLTLASLVLLSAACASEIDGARKVDPRGTLGEEVYGVFCDRLGAQSLREDLTGESFYSMCHKVNGVYASQVDQTKLPSFAADAKDEKGTTVPVEKQQADRARAIGRVEAIAKRRADLVAALDAAMPDMAVAVKDLKAKDPAASCDAPAGGGEGELYDEISAMLGRFTDLYNDGTVPNSTRSLARVLSAFANNKDAQEAYARLDSRRGYRPATVALGMVRPAAAYPRIRDLSNSLLGVIASDSQPYALDAKKDEKGDRIPVPGAAYDKFSKMLEVSHLELYNAKADPPSAPLVVTPDALADRTVLTRPRDNLEIFQEIMLGQDAAYGTGAPRWIVRRDARGYAALAPGAGAVAAPFVDADGDKLPDVDAFGAFKTKDGTAAPTPFFAVDTLQAFPRDAFQRALSGGALYYDYIDTSKTFAASMMQDMRSLVNPDAAANQGTLMDLTAGLPVMVGGRDGSFKTERKYDNGESVAFNQVKANESPLLDLVYALGQLMGDKSFDQVLLLTKQLFATKQADLARVVAAGMAARNAALGHKEATMPLKSAFWDEMIELMGDIAKDKSVNVAGTGIASGKTLLEDLMDALADDATANLGQSMGPFATLKDEISYDRNNISGPAVNVTTKGPGDPKTPVDRNQPDAGDNRSIMQRFFQLVADTDGVATCNKEGALVHAKVFGISLTLPLVNGITQPYKECEVYKIDNLAHFFLRTIVGTGRFDIRSKLMREGVLGLGAANSSLLEQSSGITGFWDSDMHPRPQWAMRLVYFDVVGDSPNSGDKNYFTNHFISDMEGPYKGTNVCPERVIPDVCFNNPDCGSAANANVAPDGKVRGLRNCNKNDWTQNRNRNAIFSLEKFGFLTSIAPIVRAFVGHKREDLFSRMSSISSKHWASTKGSEDECRRAGGATCSKDGLSSYEQLLGEVLGGDLLPALQNLMKSLKTVTVPRCTGLTAQGTCVGVTQVPATTVLVDAARAAMDPDYAKTIALKDRQGNVTSKKNDGSTYAQTTPLVMIANAMSDIDANYAKWEVEHPEDKGRKDVFVRGRSALADVFMKTAGSKATSEFGDKAIPKIVPTAVDMLRAQMWARCPKSFVPPYDRCAWAKDELPKKATDTITGPMFSSAIDLMDGIRADPNAKRETERLLQYMLDTASQNDAFASMLASAVDMLQVLKDDQNLIPFFKVLSEATTASKRDAQGRVIEKSLVDANLSLLGKISGRAYDSVGNEICRSELDPNQILPIILEKVVTPMKTPGLEGKTPLEVIMDVIADVDRVAPNEPKPKLDAADYQSISTTVTEFLISKERGLEQFYEIVRKGTKG